jgi:hypothetical protein
MAEIKKIAIKAIFSSVNNLMAGGKSLNWHPLIEDFILVARKLEKLGFIYHRRSVMVININGGSL